MARFDTFSGGCSIFDPPDERDVDRETIRRRLVKEDAALRPWLIGKALRGVKYTWRDRVKFTLASAWEAGLWAWRMSK